MDSSDPNPSSHAQDKADLSQQLSECQRALEQVQSSLYEQNNSLKEKNRELQLFFATALLADGQCNTEVALQFFIEAVCQLCDWSAAHVFRVTEDKPSIRLRPSNTWCIPDGKGPFEQFQAASQVCEFTSGEEIPGTVYESKSSAWNENYFAESNSPRAEAARSEGLRTAFGVPIFRYNKLIAVAEFFSTTTESHNQNLLNIIEAASRQLGAVLERRYSEYQSQKNHAELEQAHNELQSTQAQLVQSSKLASIGQLAAGVAHEINNPIAYVASNTRIFHKYMQSISTVLSNYQTLLEQAEKHEGLTKEVSDVKTAIKNAKLNFILEDIDEVISDSIEGMERVTDIVTGLKSFARVDEAEEQEVDINECVESTVKIIWNEIKYNCTLEKHLSPLPRLNCNPGKINQVLMNLLVNAGHAIKDTGTIGIKTFSENKHVYVEISDTGCGIAEEELTKIFDPFFTTKPVGVGTGLGLSISHGIIEQHGGSIHVESKINEGTTFQIRLPVVEQQPPMQ